MELHIMQRSRRRGRILLGFYDMDRAEKEAKEAMKDYISPSPKALAALHAGIESAKRGPVVVSSENFAQYAND